MERYLTFEEKRHLGEIFKAIPPESMLERNLCLSAAKRFLSFLSDIQDGDFPSFKSVLRHQFYCNLYAIVIAIEVIYLKEDISDR